MIGRIYGHASSLIKHVSIYFTDHRFGYLSMIPNVIMSYGWNSGDKFTEWFGEQLKARTGNADITFQEVTFYTTVQPYTYDRKHVHALVGPTRACTLVSTQLRAIKEETILHKLAHTHTQMYMHLHNRVKARSCKPTVFRGPATHPHTHPYMHTHLRSNTYTH